MEDVSFQTALRQILAAIAPLPAEGVSLDGAMGRVLSEKLCALVDVPSADVSLKDGYALRSSDIAHARQDNPVSLRLRGVIAAGSVASGPIQRESAVKVLSGAQIPAGADAVLSCEFAVERGQWMTALAGVEKGQNILFKGTDLDRGGEILRKGTRLRPLQTRQGGRFRTAPWETGVLSPRRPAFQPDGIPPVGPPRHADSLRTTRSLSPIAEGRFGGDGAWTA
jgi:molybdopterin molybdotransferase